MEEEIKPPTDSSITLSYSGLPKDQIFRWHIDDDVRTLTEFRGMVKFLRHWGTLTGRSFGGKKNLSCLQGYAMVQVEVVCKGETIKFLISRFSLYLHAFYTPILKWLRFNDTEIYIKEFPTLLDGSRAGASYRCTETWAPWDYLGPKVLIDAFSKIIEAKEAKDVVKPIQIFFVHIAESSRFYLIESEVESTLYPEKYDQENADDVSCTKAEKISLDVSKKAPAKLRFMIKNFGDMSRVWLLYALSGYNKQLCLSERIMHGCGFEDGFVELDNHLALLSNVDVEKHVSQTKGKVKRGSKVKDLEGLSDEIMLEIERNLLKIPNMYK